MVRQDCESSFPDDRHFVYWTVFEGDIHLRKGIFSIALQIAL
jgi:hypothetical protein